LLRVKEGGDEHELGKSGNEKPGDTIEEINRKIQEEKILRRILVRN
jgi:hypothetical protein